MLMPEKSYHEELLLSMILPGRGMPKGVFFQGLFIFFITVA